MLALGVLLAAGLAGPHRVLAQNPNDPPVKIYFYHLDHLGTPRVITDENGQVVSTHKYLPFGEELTPVPSTNSHKFTGHERDKETGLDYMLARYFSSGGTFRFLAVDPIVTPNRNLYEPQRWNRYVYSANNPVKFIDPDGRDFVAAAAPETKTMTIKVNIVMTGSGASPETASKFQDQANKTFSSGATTFKGKDGSTWTLKVEVSATTDSSEFTEKDRPNTLNVSDGGATEMTAENKGTLNTSDLGNPNTAAHEAAHMIGLGDQYNENTNQPNPGKEGSLMGDPKNPDAKPTQEEAQKMGEQGEAYVEATKKDK